MRDFFLKNQFSEILYYLISFGTLSLVELKYPSKYGKCILKSWREIEFDNHKKHPAPMWCQTMFKVSM